MFTRSRSAISPQLAANHIINRRKAVFLFGAILNQLSAYDLPKDRAGQEQGDECVGETAPPAHDKDEGDHKVYGKPPLNGELTAPGPPPPEGEGSDEGHGQKGDQQEGALGV
jgi:hypothetical protein